MANGAISGRVVPQFQQMGHEVQRAACAEFGPHRPHERTSVTGIHCEPVAETSGKIWRHLGVHGIRQLGRFTVKHQYFRMFRFRFVVVDRASTFKAVPECDEEGGRQASVLSFEDTVSAAPIGIEAALEKSTTRDND